MSSRAIEILAKGLAPEVRQAVARRHDTFSRELAYMEERGHKKWKDVVLLGWNKQRLETVAALVVFHDVVLGPLRAVTIVRCHPANPLNVPVVAGSVRVDDEFVRGLKPMLDAFDRILVETGVPASVLGSRSARDMVYWLIRANRDES